jgi:hypothetical protein
VKAEVRETGERVANVATPSSKAEASGCGAVDRLGLVTEVRLRGWRAGDAAGIAPMLQDSEVLKRSHLEELGTDRWVVEQREGRRGH